MFQNYSIFQHPDPSKLLSLLCCLGLLVAMPVTSFAQDASSGENELVLEEVIVTAQKREQSLQDTPIAVTAFSQDMLVDIGVLDVTDLGDSVPTLHVVQDQNQYIQLTLRGITSTNNTENGDPAVSFNVDGVYQARPSAATALMFDVERVEVLRGPQGTLYGRNSTAGAVNLITRRPGSEFEGTASAVFGDYDRIGAQAAFNIPLGETFALRVAAITEVRDSYNTAGPGTPVPVADDEMLDTRDDFAARVSAFWTPTENFSWLLTYDHLHSESLAPGFVAGANPPDIRTYDIKGPSSTDMNIASLRSRIDWNLSDQYILSYMASYNPTERDQHTAGLMPSAELPGGSATLINQDTTNDSTTHELQLSYSNSDTGTNWMVGAFYFDEENEVDFIVDVLPFLGVRFIQPDTTANANALFGQGTFALTESLNLTLGARYSEDEKANKGGRQFLCPPPNGINPLSNCFIPLADNSATGDWSKTTWRAELDWDYSDNSFVYGSVATGYKSGGFTSANAYGEESVTTFELGSKSDLLDGRLRLNAALFHTKFDDMQVPWATSLPGGGITQRVDNVGQSTITGFEAEFTWLVSQAGRVQGFLAFQDAEFDDYTNGQDDVFEPGIIQDFSGNKLAYAPELAFTVAYDHTWHLSGGGNIRPRVSFAWKDDYYLRPSNRPVDDLQDSHSIIDASIRYTSPDGDWSVEAFGQNLGDEEVKLHGFNTAGNGVLVYRYAPPRTWGVRGTYNWGN